MLIIGHETVRGLLAGRERELIGLVADAYRRHDEGLSALPHSVFLRFPDQPRNRIIGLPGFLGGADPVAGLKWIASYPGNIDSGRERASASIILNSLETGYPQAFIEGSLISAQRTAASAALGARLLSGDRTPTGVALIGCGVINREILRFLMADNPKLTAVTVYDSDPARAEAFAAILQGRAPSYAKSDNKVPFLADVAVAGGVGEAVGAHELVSIATTAAAPHMDLAASRPGAVVLHVSLRDLTTATILASHNVVDDPDHVLRERTSPHLAQEETGRRDFIDASIGALLRGTATLRPEPGRPLVYSPFGLGVLDLALARYVHDEAARRGLGTTVDDFLPPSANPVEESR
ncbi:2,3-diaminopropionate biosynthesis protein SbnB [Phytohabitans rumicis]|uniref:2,3-diaminopropionate biosynthesis protein SbnB n=1 Tax=Phytohabitans rumicis TaxID=1076125 RepID=A0A6V8LF23_9ACTN|nr:2,3-diaminopropionate biosynthesis protein SbnB [Phytohabitans rumicis]GFJ94260.1 2,3-diaminopropionate biosynthesis protein SbnB [Phytohabitans rumicis]